MAEPIAPNESHNVSRATYPIPKPIISRLKSGILFPSDVSSQRKRVVETAPAALSQLVSNAIEAMDAMYFATPANIRKHPAFQHRLCLRIHTDPEAKTLSITDLGVGMTRADLINSLGIGKAGLMMWKTNKEESSTATSDEDEWDEETTEDDGAPGTATDEDVSEEDERPTQQNGKHEKDEENAEDTLEESLPCRTVDIGGFYAALCALGIGVRVGTKSKFDDYYEFELGLMSDDQREETAFNEFRVIRPHPEGTELTVKTGFDKFENIRGESGTCVELRLNQDAIDSGLLDENVLKPIFLKIVETTQYTVAFSTDQQAQSIIDASEKERQVLIDMAKEHNEDSLDGLANMDLTSRKENIDTAYNSVKERAKYIPVRLSLGERKMLRLVEATMTCCDYTTEVDQTFKSAARRTHEQLKGVTAVLRGLVTACDYNAGQKLLQDDNFAEYETFFRQMFEIARRHKIMNPEKMRTEYGKLIYLLQDAVSPSLKPHLGFSVKGPILSVYRFLEEREGLDLLSDELIETATEEILAEKKSRATINNEIRRKERAVKILKQKYRSSQLSEEDIHLCLYSICDNNSFLNSNRVPVDKVIAFLTEHVSPKKFEDGYSLAIISGEEGARLSHSHERQYYFALQSLTLWRDIIDDMFRLWAMAEEDLLSDGVTYSLQDTGQGMQRVQQCPRTYKAMQKILLRVKAKVSHWVGSSVIHMGDHNVPNALSFIDKYTQVPRILGPIVTCLENLEQLCEKDEGIATMVNEGFGGPNKLRKDILYDFFRSAFDGSGADNFYDAGSCIDGRLTSAWNWCSQLPEKPFFPIFKLTGFIGFDGEFK